MRAILSFISFYTILSLTVACQTKPKQEADATKQKGAVQEDSILALATRPGADAPRSAADRLVRALYFEHNKTDNPLRETKDRALIDQFFAPPTGDLIWTYAQKNGQKRMKTNLLYDAPDAQIKKMWVEPAAIGGTKAVVYVTFLKNEKPDEVRVELSQQANQRWRITDMIYGDGKRLTALMK